MGDSSSSSSCCQKYGVPIYGAGWVPSQAISFNNKPIADDDDEDNKKPITESTQPRNDPYLVFCGGGGEGRSGIPNALLISQFNVASNSLSPNPVARLGTETDLPYRMAVHPGGDGVICSFPESCRYFEWNIPENTEIPELALRSSERVLDLLENVGQQLAVTFNPDGSALAVGGEDGHLRVFKWPSMEAILDQIEENSSVKDISFSSDGKFLVSLCSRGPGRVWDVSELKVVASLPKEKDEVFGSCRFSQTKDNRQILYVAAMQSKGGSIVCWDSASWKRIKSKQIVRDPISALSVSADGYFVSVGTIQGDIYIMNSSLRVHTIIKKAHVGLLTVLSFSPDSRYLASSSLDSSVRVTVIGKDKKQNGSSIWVLLFIVLVALLAYILASKHAISSTHVLIK